MNVTSPPLTRATRRRIGAALVLLAAALAVLPAIGAGPVLHEYFAPNADEDLELGARAAGGKIPAAIPGPAAPIPAPDVHRDPYASFTTYGGALDTGGSESGYKVDRTTSRPNSVKYHEPFIPSIAPFKRLYAYDAVDDSLGLEVSGSSLIPLEVGGNPKQGEDQFYADLAVELVPNTAVRIPSVGPGSRVLAANASPSVPFELLQDVAENWFVKSQTRQRVRLTLQLAIARRAFGTAFAATSFEQLEPRLQPIPAQARTAARRVGAKIGLSPTQSPAEVLELLVHHFRSFAPSDDYPDASTGVALYEELSLSQKGVCRHRAYGFVVTALAYGIPTRMIRNEAHAWVEVYDGAIWQRIDLGGAAEQLELERENSFEPYRNPKDPYSWPARAEAGSGQDMVRRALRSGGEAVAPSLQAEPTNADAPTATSRTSGSANVDPLTRVSREPAQLDVAAESADVRRGNAFHVVGRLHSGSGACANARVDVYFRGERDERIFVQSLGTDGEGRFDRRVTIPVDVPVGEYTLVLNSPGTVDCAAVALE